MNCDWNLACEFAYVGIIYKEQKSEHVELESANTTEQVIPQWKEDFKPGVKQTLRKRMVEI